MKNKKIALILFIFSIAILMIPFCKFSAAYSDLWPLPTGAKSWSGMDIVDISGTSGHYHALNLSGYGANISTCISGSDDGCETYNDLYHGNTTRVLYQRKIKVAYKDTINLVAATTDEGSGGTNIVSNGKFYWNIVEHDASGNAIYDSGWLETSKAYQVGVSTGGDLNRFGHSRSSVSYIILIFRYATGDMSVGSASPEVTPAKMATDLPNLYLCYNDFTYTVTNQDSSTTFNRTGISSTGNKFSDPTRTGYTFAGWKVSSSNTSGGQNWMNGNTYTSAQLNTYFTNGTFYTSLFGNATFTAQWNANTYYVTYDNNGGSGGPPKQSFVYNSTAYLSNTIPTRTGYTFLNWYISDNGQTKSPGAQIPKGWGSFTAVAQWQANNYTLTIHPNGGTFSDGTTAAKTTNPPLTYNALSWWNVNGVLPSRTGYVFKGYYTETEGGNIVYDETGACVTGTGYWTEEKKYCYPNNLTVYARWQEDNYDIVYHINGGNTLDGGTESTIKKTIKYKDPVDLSVVATRNRMKFIGWGVEPSSKEPISSLTSFILTGDTEGDNAYKNYVSDNTLNLYAIYSYEVSDIKEVVLGIWNTSDEKGTYKEYPLSLVQTLAGSYVYALQNKDVTGSLVSTDWSNTRYCIYVKDNAGNVNYITGPQPPVEVEEYAQTVIHKVWNMEEEEYQEAEREVVYVRCDKTFEPAYMESLLTWNKGENKPGAYVVKEAKTIEVTYKPKKLTVVLDAQGGKFADGTRKKEHTVYMNTLYGTFDTAFREGYTHTGWYTKPNAEGTLITSSDRYPYPNPEDTIGPLTLYAAWEINYYTPVYDFWTNGGNHMEELEAQYQSLAYGSNIYLDINAYKEGWDFIGWNTDDEKTEPIADNITISTNPKPLYALFKKNLSLSLIDISGTIPLSHTIYNKEKNYVFENIPMPREEQGWKQRGWSTGDKANSYISAGAYSNYVVTENSTLYALYEKEITVSYDTGNPNHTIMDETKKAYYNASGDTIEATFTVQEPNELNNNQFMYWYDENGNKYYPGDEIKLTETTHLTAYWDEYPSLVVYERYFTLTQAQEGKITIDELMKDMTVSDREDDAAGIHVNRGIEGFDLEEIKALTNTADIRITYWVEDSAGNRVEQDMVFHVVKTEASIDTRVAMSRFISKDYFNTATSGVFVSEAAGGLKSSSAWKTNAAYSSLLTNTLALEKTGFEFKDLMFGSSQQQVQIQSSGRWSQMYASYTYSSKDISDIKEYVLENGFSRFLNAQATKEFIEKFMNLNATE